MAMMLAVIACKTYTLKQDGMSITINLYSDGAKFELEVPYATIDKSFVFHLKTDKGECPGYAYWFSKDNLELPALTLSSGCIAEESNIRIRYELGTDFGKRDKDLVETGIFKFNGQLYYTESIDKFEIEKYTKLRVIRSNQGGARIDNTYNI